MRIYIVVFEDPFGDWEIEGAFVSKEKANDYIVSRTTPSSCFWIEDKVLECTESNNDRA